MRASMIIVIAALATGCEDHAREHAATGAMPAVATPVGPIPGPGEAPNATANPFKASPEILMEGRRLFLNMNCAGCHGSHAGGGMGPSLRDEDWIYGDSDLQIYDSIVEGRAHGMPSWGIRIPEEQVWKMVAYIHSLRTDHEPEPPQ